MHCLSCFNRTTMQIFANDLMQQSEYYSNFTAEDVADNIGEAINKDRFLVIANRADVVGFCTYTYMTEEEAAKYVENSEYYMIDYDSNDGDLWLIDFMTTSNVYMSVNAVRKWFLRYKVNGGYILRQRKDGSVRKGWIPAKGTK